MRLKKIVTIIGVVIPLFMIMMLGGIFALVHNKIIDLSVLEHYSSGKPSLLLDDAGQVWGTFELEKHEDVLFHELPQHLIQAFVAAEDHNFFNHMGISWIGIARSLLVNCFHGAIVQGASTITQQLAKLLFTDSSRTFKRKIKEQLFALLIEQQFSKEQIFQTYLNHVYFGAGLYGVEAASKRFWQVSAREISLDQAATLAAIVKNPSHYCPLWYPLSVQRRRNIVLHSMKKMGFITPEVYEQTRQIPVALASQPDTNIVMAYIKETIRQWLEPAVGRHTLYRGGLRIATTINQTLQQQAEKAFSDQITSLRLAGMGGIDGGLLSVEVGTGHIKALVGGYDFTQSQYNRALQARRQIGSIIKPLIYAAAVEAGIPLVTTVDDEPFEMQISGQAWAPRNATRKFEGTMTLARALATSNNIASIKTLLAVTPERIVHLLQKCHVQTDIEPYPSLALGCIDCTVKEVAGMFSIFAHHGMYIEPHLVRWVQDATGKKIMKIKPIKEQVISAMASGQVASMLRNGITRACLRSGKTWSGSEAIGKTGTTNESRTLWFAGSTSRLTTVIYLGADDNRSLGARTFPGRVVFPIWYALYCQVPQHPKFIYDPLLSEMTIDGRTGVLCSNQNADALSLLVPKNHQLAGHLIIAS
jgi:penicillin-binding protein 1A